MYYVYILTNKTNKVMYIGVTNDITRRVYEHRNHLVEGFTSKYNVTKLVYVETAKDVRDAIQREKQLKGWIRAKKNALVESVNPQWKDLWDEIVQIFDKKTNIISHSEERSDEESMLVLYFTLGEILRYAQNDTKNISHPERSEGSRR